MLFREGKKNNQRRYDELVFCIESRSSIIQPKEKYMISQTDIPIVIEPVPTGSLDSFFGISMLFLTYIGISATVSVVLSYISPTVIPTIVIFLTVAALLLAPFWPLFKKYYPEQPKID